MILTNLLLDNLFCLNILKLFEKGDFLFSAKVVKIKTLKPASFNPSIFDLKKVSEYLL